MRRIIVALVVIAALAVPSVGTAGTASKQVTRKQAELRYQLCQPRHWRALILKP